MQFGDTAQNKTSDRYAGKKIIFKLEWKASALLWFKTKWFCLEDSTQTDTHFRK